jgi:uncharacterized RDD family membrane protein YckC
MSDPTYPPPGEYPPGGQGTPGGYPPPQQPPPGGYPPQQPPQGAYPPPQAQPYGQPYGQQPAYGAPTGYGPSDQVTLPTGQTVKLGDTGQRFLGRLIDALIIGAVYGVLYAIVIAGAIASTEVDPVTGEVEGGAGFAVIWLVSILIFAVLGVLYEVGLIAVRGATIGKQLMGLKVVNESTGDLIGWGPSFMRWLLPSAAGWFTCGIGALVVLLSFLWDNSGRRQGWHDKVAKDLVISTK